MSLKLVEVVVLGQVLRLNVPAEQIGRAHV